MDGKQEKTIAEENSSSTSEKTMFKDMVKNAALKRMGKTPGQSSNSATTGPIIGLPKQILQIDGTNESSLDFFHDMARLVDGYQANNLTDEALRDQFVSHLFKISILSATLLSRWSSKAPTFDILSRLKSQKDKLENLSTQVSQLSTDKQQAEQELARLNQENYKLNSQLLHALDNHERELVQAKDEWYAKGQHDCYSNFSNTKDGKKVLEAYWESKKMKFLKSNEFKGIMAEMALDYYYHGFESCVKQLEPEDQKHDCLDRDAGLQDLPEPKDMSFTSLNE